MRCILGRYRRYSNIHVTLLAGGVGGARMARALRAVLDPGLLTVVVNVGDDTERYGVHVSPDPDTVMYTLAGTVGPHGWGRADDTTAVMASLAFFGVDTSFALGDADLAMCIARSLMLSDGVPLSTITAQFCAALGVTDVAIIPASDDRLRTAVQINDGSWLGFQEYFVDRQHKDTVAAVAFVGSDEALPAPGVVDAIDGADVVVIAPSNPPLSIWPILAIDGVAEAVGAHSATVAVSPLFGGHALKGPAEEVMSGVGLAKGTRGVIEAYADWVHTLFVDRGDAEDVDIGGEFDVRVLAADTRLTGSDSGASFASELIEAMQP